MITSSFHSYVRSSHNIHIHKTPVLSFLRDAHVHFSLQFYNNMIAHCSQGFLLCFFSCSVLCLFTKANSEKNIVHELLKQGCERLSNQTQFFLQTDFVTPLLNGYRFCSITTQKSPLGLEVERKTCGYV